MIGGKPQIIEETVSKLRKEYAGIHIIGYRDGYIKANEERERLIKDITEKDLMWYLWLWGLLNRNY